jgi:bifunctional DNase/RNase
MSKMVEVVIDSVRVSLTNQQRIVVLREVNVDRFLPIWIGPYEAEAITIALQEIEVARPQTHDLLSNILKALNCRLLRVEVINLQEDVFYGNLVVEATINIDSRPSDALALAARSHVPILVSSEVLDVAGIVPEQELEETEGGAESTGGEKGGEERLSVFEDFLQKIDMDDFSSSGDKKKGDKDKDDEDKDEDEGKGKGEDKSKPK